MRAVTVHDLKRLDGGSVLAFDLIDVLRLAEPGAGDSRWRCRYIDRVGEHAAGVHGSSDSGAIVPGDELLRLASGVDQVIDGDFVAFRHGADRPWFVVRAIDSTLYVVATEDGVLLDRVRERFRDVRDAPEEVDDLAPWWNG
jgi:hypothetical protein